MDEFDIIAYLENNLEGAELEAFEKELQQNPEFAREVNLQRQLSEDIEIQGIRSIVTSVLSEKKEEKGRPYWRFWGLAGLLILIAGLFLYLRNQSPQEASEAESPIMQEVPETTTPTEPEPSPTKEETLTNPNETELPLERQTPRPIASVTQSELSPPLYPSPNVRGAQEGNEVWKAILDSIWYTAYPPEGIQFVEPFDQVDQLLQERNFSKAYVRLQLLERKIPDNDSLSYLKGYCLLEMGEGAEALRYFEKIKTEQKAWMPYLEWYRGLATILTGNQAEAVRQFEPIRLNTEHPFQQQAKKAILLLE